MGLEAATYINQLVSTNPVGATDPKGQGDDHIRLLKSTIQATFPNITGPVTVTQAQLNAVGVSGITGFAAPSVNIALTPTAGVATTAMRSDAAPALSQAIAPTWSGLHTFTNAGGIRLERAGSILLTLRDNSAALDAKGWQFRNTAGQFNLYTLDDTDAAVRSALAITRAGSGVASLVFGNVANNPTYSFLGTGDLSFAGTASWSGTHLFTGAATPVHAVTGVRISGGNAGQISQSNFAAPSGTRNFDSFISNAGVLTYRAIADNLSGSTSWLTVAGAAGSTIGNINFPSGTLQYGGIEVGYRGLPSRNFSANDNTAASDNGRQVRYTSTGHTFTLDSDIPTDGIVIIRNAGTGVLNIAASGTLTWFNGGGSLPTGARVLAVGGIATAQHIGGGNYEIWGNAGLS